MTVILLGDDSQTGKMVVCPTKSSKQCPLRGHLTPAADTARSEVACFCLRRDEKEKTKVPMDNRTVKLSFRLSENEFVNMKTAMELEGFRSVSRYVRHVLSGESIRRRSLKPTDENLQKQLTLLSADIKKIGNNYNQVVKAVNTAVAIRKKDGSPAVSTRSLEYRISELHGQMQEIITLVRKVLEQY